MNALSTRETRIVTRERRHRPTAFERVHGEVIRRPSRGNARAAAIHASTLGV
jgi:hypothetical protein